MEVDFFTAESAPGRFSLFKKINGHVRVITVDLLSYQAESIKRALKQAYEMGKRHSDPNFDFRDFS